MPRKPARSATSTTRTHRHVAGRLEGKGFGDDEGVPIANSTSADAHVVLEGAISQTPDVESMSPEVRAAYIELVAAQVADWSAELNRRLA